MDESADPREVVVGLDDSAGARTALDWAVREAQLRGRGIRLVTVWPDDGPPRVPDGAVDPSGAAGFEEDARARMHALAAEVAGGAGGDAVSVRAAVRYGQPAEQLIDTAAADGLLVVGSRGRGRLRGAVLGSVSQQCAQYARGPVVVVRDDESTHGAVLWQGPASRVVVGVDGSAGSVVALRFAAAEARLRGGELHVVHAWIERFSGFGGLPWALPVAAQRDRAETVLQDSLRAAWNAPPAGVRIRAETVEGAEWDVLTEAAEAADLLVVGARGRSGWPGLLLGSVSLRCITYAPCPVAVVRPPRSGEQPAAAPEES